MPTNCVEILNTSRFYEQNFIKHFVARVSEIVNKILTKLKPIKQFFSAIQFLCYFQVLSVKYCCFLWRFFYSIQHLLDHVQF